MSTSLSATSGSSTLALTFWRTNRAARSFDSGSVRMSSKVMANPGPPRCQEASRISARVASSISGTDETATMGRESPAGVVRLNSCRSPKLSLSSWRASSSSGRLRAGTVYCGVRWKT